MSIKRNWTVAGLSVFLLGLSASVSQAAFSSYMEIQQGAMAGNGIASYYGGDAVPAMYQAWDGSSFVITTRMTIPTGTTGAVSERGAGIYLGDLSHGDRYIIGLNPSKFNQTDHRGKGMLYWENSGGMNFNTYTNLASGGVATYFDIRVSFNSTTKVLDVDYRLEGDANYSDLMTHAAPANFSPSAVGLAVYSFAVAAGPWAPAAGQQLQFDDFNISGGTGTAVSDNFDSVTFTNAHWQYHSGKLNMQNVTTFTQVVPEPATSGLMALGLLALARRVRRA